MKNSTIHLRIEPQDEDLKCNGCLFFCFKFYLFGKNVVEHLLKTVLSESCDDELFNNQYSHLINGSIIRKVACWGEVMTQVT